ncbi:MAG: nitrophenyl compound nitroreductase subunit ArsF family protein [bacterium]
MRAALGFLVALSLLIMIVPSLGARPGDSTAAAPPSPSSAVSPGDTSRTVPPDTTNPSRRTIAYYFYTTARCASCLKIETYSREALEAGFAAEMKRGGIEWRMVNVDLAENAHFIKEYQLFTKSLVLVEETRGERGRWKNLPRVWSLLTDADAFRKYVQDETRLFIGKKP